MRARTTARLLLPLFAALAIAALTLYAYRDLIARPFAADDYQWLLNVRGLSFGEIARKAFDPGAQTHFYRPLIWLLFWAQTRAFGLDPRGFHAVSLALHLLNAALLGGLAYRLQIAVRAGQPQSTIYNLQSTIPLLVAVVVALHPAPFEAVVWISAQSELLAATLLLVALHFWLPRQRDKETRRQGEVRWRLPSSLSPHLLVSTAALGLALLAKESAVIGLPLLMLLGRTPKNQEPRTQNQEPENRRTGEPENHDSEDKETRRQGDEAQVAGFSIFNFQFSIFNFAPYLLPTLLTLAYIALQIGIERRNYLLAQGGYGLGAQVVLNPLRSLALIIAPLPGTEHADAAWLIPVGALVAVMLLAWTIWECRRQSTIYNLQSAILVALALTLLPTAPFTSPPDSRYLYLPVMAATLLIISALIRTKNGHPQAQPRTGMRLAVLGSQFLVLCVLWWASGELHAREGRFAAASGPGGSLWHVATAACAESRPDRMVIVEPPVAAPHVEAIVELACGDATRTKIVGGDQVEGAVKGHTVVIAFPNGSAEVQRRT